ncbi:MAG: hypothetical protein AAFO07_18580 [Bacteroidota bacterium]
MPSEIVCNKTKTIICILGMHRSGTSLTARWLQASGLNIGNNLMGKGVGNIDGHFEDFDFVEFHNEILCSNNIHIYPTIEPIIPKNHDNYSKAINLINKKPQTTPWGWKDPRTCLFVDLWQEVIPNIKFLVVFRHYDEVVNSLLKRDLNYLSTSKSQPSIRSILSKKKAQLYLTVFRKQFIKSRLKTWCVHNEKILNLLYSIDPKNYLVLQYSTINQYDEKIIDFIINQWEVGLNFIPFDTIFDKTKISFPTHSTKYGSKEAMIWNKLLQFEKETLSKIN